MVHELILSDGRKSEEALCGLAFVRPTALLSVDLDDSAFSDPLLAKLIHIAKANLDTNRIIAEALKIGLPAHRIADLAHKAGLECSIRDYTHAMLRTRQAQNLEVLAGRLFRDVLDNPQIEIGDVVQWIEGELLKLRTGTSLPPLVDLVDVFDEAMAAHERRLETGESEAISTGFRVLDSQTGGFFPGQLWQIAARSYMGKTALALDMAGKISRWAKVLFVSLEMSRHELVDRLVASMAQIAIGRYTKGELTRAEIERSKECRETIARMPIKFSTSPADSVASIRSKIRLMKSQVGCGVVVVDNLQLLKPADYRPPRHERIKQCTIDLKAVARELDVAILLLSQLDASAEGQEPTDKNYAGSKETLPDLDISILLHRATKDDPDVEVICTKNRRGGPPFRTKLLFDGPFQSFSEPKNEFEEWAG